MKTSFPIVILLAGSACGSYYSPVQPSSGCGSDKAQILVGDGYLQNLCGCQEATALIRPPATLTCTLPVGRVVLFLYLGTTLKHQIIPTNQSAFTPSPLSDPKSSKSPRVHSVQFPVQGTYGFQDSMNQTLSGRIIVQ